MITAQQSAALRRVWVIVPYPDETGMCFSKGLTGPLRPLNFTRANYPSLYDDVAALNSSIRPIARQFDTVLMLDFQSRYSAASLRIWQLKVAVMAMAGARGAEVILVGMEEMIEAAEKVGTDQNVIDAASCAEALETLRRRCVFAGLPFGERLMESSLPDLRNPARLSTAIGDIKNGKIAFDPDLGLIDATGQRVST